MSMLEAADLALVNDLTGAPSFKQRRALAKVITLLE
jgi:LAO/AO transport system kinase